ncbi:uncharacterized protein LOC110460608 [Mizuhopecten yessoensis]|uniref:Serine/threonine-protein kinase/receptor n=1 Tax=Mizuhopecten yessoensis TaxID=6573 RepID=A0A210Q230_MIZYE|nr:uncharacterized protein LOC110460608 [Mizuhopecten yessoensis]OWF42782.1 Serine/threonine-protein kinase/receptor [Mizuhopecten yessoensis]
MTTTMMSASVNSDDSGYLDAVERAEEYDDLFDIADKLGVSTANLDEIEEIKERLVMHLTRTLAGNPKDLNANSMAISSQEDKHKREKLLSLLVDLQKIMEKHSVEATGELLEMRGTDAIASYLKIEGTSDDLKKEMETKIKSLKEEECRFVVAGETSAGKSTLINLLLGSDILPTSMQSCTSVITKISYGSSLGAEIVYKNGKVRRFFDLTQESLEKEVWPIIFVRDDKSRQRETETDVLHVKFEVPACILKCGLVLIDSPGIGENEAMDDIIASYVQENFVMGFVYVIKSDNAGGVDEDRLLTLIRVILEKQRTQSDDKTAIPFNPKSTVFVCNRWDAIKPNEQDVVFKNAVKKLSKCWPSLSADQIVRMSTTSALREANVDADFIPETYRIMLEHLRNIYIIALDTRIQSTYQWVANVVTRSMFHIGAIVRDLNTSEEDINQRTRNITKNLEALQHKAEDVFLRLHRDLEEKTNEVCKEFRERLKRPSVKEKLLRWETCELPSSDGKTWPQVKDKLDFKFSQRLSDVLEEWNEENNYIVKIEEKIFSEVHEELNILQSDFNAIEKNMGVTELSKSLSKSMHQQLHAATPMASIFGMTNPGVNEQAMPLKLMTQAQNPWGKILQRVKMVDEFRNACKRKSYSVDPMKIATKRAESSWKKMVLKEENDNILKSFVESIMERPMKQLSKIQKNIPALIDSNKKSLEHAFCCRLDAMESKNRYHFMLKDFETPAKHISDFGNGYIAITTFRNEQLELQEEFKSSLGKSTNSFRSSNVILDGGATTSMKRVERGLWTVLQPGKVSTNDGSKDTTIRMYSRLSGVESTFREVARIKRLNCPNIAKLLGIHYSDAPPPVSLFLGNLDTLSIARNQDPMGFKVDIPRIFLEVAAGVNYFHCVQMVHMELSINTVTVDQYRNVKLTGGCFPRHAKLPENSSEIRAAEFVYIPPFVLRGHKYVNRADIYAFGLLMYEVLCIDKPFRSKHSLSLSDFTKTMHLGQCIRTEQGFSRLESKDQIIIEELVNMTVPTDRLCDTLTGWTNSSSSSQPNVIHQRDEDTKL